MGSQSVGLVHIQRLLADHDVGDTVVAGHAGKLILVIGGDGGGRSGIDGIGQAGNLEEAAVLIGVLAGAELQGIQNLLTGGLHQAGLVAEGMDVDNALIGDVACGDISADTAAVDKGHVSAQHHAVGIGAQVAQVGLAAANQTVALGVLGGQLDLGLGDDLLQLGLESVVLLLHESGNGLILLVIASDQLVGDLTGLGVDDQLADSSQLGAGLRPHHVLAVLVGDGLLDLLVGMAINEDVDAGSVGNDGLGLPDIGGAGVAQVAQGDHIVRTFSLGGVNGLLHGGIEVLAVVALLEAVDVLALVVLEVGRGRLDKGLGGVDAHIGNLHVAVGQHLVGLEDGLTVQVGEVGADVGILRLLRGQGQEVVHAVIELMVAGDCQVVAHLVHDLHDGGAFGQGADGTALDGIASVN